MSMSTRQYAFLITVLLVWLASDAGWIVLAAIAAGLIALGVVEVVKGDVDLGELGERLRSSTSSRNS